MANQGEKQAVTVRIGGEDHTIRANVEPEYTERCAKLADSLNCNGNSKPNRSAIGAAVVKCGYLSGSGLTSISFT